MKMKSVTEVLALAFALSAASFTTAHAHFKLLAPDSWLNEGDLGEPQKGSPCGPGGDDDVSPVPMSMKVTTVHAGDTLEIKIQETVHHPGWFRIALDTDPSAFKDPDFPNANCTVDMSKVPTGAHDNVLADGLDMDTNLGGANRMITEKVTIPNKPCDKCKLQIIQVMADAVHSPPGCVYHHCADLKIVAADANSTAGSGATAGSSASTAGSSATAGASGSTSAAGGSGGATAASSAGKGGSTTGSAGSSSTTTPTSTAAAGKSGTTTTTTGTTSSGQTGTAGSKSAAGSTAAPSGGTAGAGTSTPAASPPASSGGCSVTHVASTSNDLFAFGLGTIVAAAFARRFKKRSGRRQLES